MPLDHRPLANAPEVSGPDPAASGRRPLASSESIVASVSRHSRSTFQAAGDARRSRSGRLPATRRRRRQATKPAQRHVRPGMDRKHDRVRASARVLGGLGSRSRTALRFESAPLSAGAIPSSHFGSWCTSTTSGKPGSDERAKMVDSDVELRISGRLEARFDHRVPGGAGVFHQEVDVAVRACERILVVLRDLGPFISTTGPSTAASTRWSTSGAISDVAAAVRAAAIVCSAGVSPASDRAAPRAARRRESAGRTRAARARSGGRGWPRGMRRTRSHCYSAL